MLEIISHAQLIRVYKCLLFASSALICFIYTSYTYATVVINEFSTNPQQIEIYNNSPDAVNIGGWVIDDNGGSAATYSIQNDEVIAPYTCNIYASNFYWNTSSSDTVRLIHGSTTVDSYTYNTAPSSSMSYQRSPDIVGSFAIQTSTFGSLLNGVSCKPIPTSTLTPTLTLTETPTIIPSLTPTQTQTPTLTPTNTLTPTPIYPTPAPYTIILHEYMPDPSNNIEWVEIVNTSSTTVQLSQWYIDDIASGGAAPTMFSILLEPYAYGVIEMPYAILNNTGDSVRLLDAAQQQQDVVSYTSSTEDISWGMSQNIWCAQPPTKGYANVGCIAASPTPTLYPTEIPDPTKTPKPPTPTRTVTPTRTPTPMRETILETRDQHTSQNTLQQNSQRPAYYIIYTLNNPITIEPTLAALSPNVSIDNTMVEIPDTTPSWSLLFIPIMLYSTALCSTILLCVKLWHGYQQFAG